MTRVTSRPSTKPSARGFTLGISMGSTNHTGRILTGIVDWINESGFEFGIIDLSDTLNRYSLMLDGMTESAAFILARKQGNEWFQENLKELKSIQVPIKIIRWDEWLNDPRHPSAVKEIKIAISSNTQLRAAMYADIANFYARKGYACTPENAHFSMQYLVEEMAAHTLLHSDYDVAAIYPGKQLETYKLIRSNAVSGFPSGIARSAHIRLIPHDVNAWGSETSQPDGKMAVGQGSF